MKKTRLLLIHPRIHPHSMVFGTMEPYALEVLAGGINQDERLKNEMEMKILDLRIDGNGLNRTLINFNPDLVGVTGITIDYPTVIEIIRDVKKFSRKVVTIVGGHHATMCPWDFFLPEVDFIVKGRGVTALKKIILEFRGNKKFDGIDGIIFQDGGDFIKNPNDDNPSELIKFPLPERSLTKAYRHKYNVYGDTFALLLTSFGCPFRCSFCACWKVSGGKYIVRSSEEIVEEIIQIPEKKIFIADDHTFFDIKKVERLYELIKESGVKKYFEGYCRADTIAYNPGIFKKWKSIGLGGLVVGIEAVTDEELRDFNKKGTVEINEKANKVLLDCGIHNYAHVLIRPDFEKKDFDRVIKYVLKLGVAHPTFPTLTPLPGTQFREISEDIFPDKHQYYDLAHPLLPMKITPKEYYRELNRIYNINYSFKRWLICQVKKIVNLMLRREYYPKEQTNCSNLLTLIIMQLWKFTQLNKSKPNAFFREFANSKKK